MDLSFTGRGMRVTEDIRLTAEQKLAPLERLEPRTTARWAQAGRGGVADLAQDLPGRS